MQYYSKTCHVYLLIFPDFEITVNGVQQVSESLDEQLTATKTAQISNIIPVFYLPPPPPPDGSLVLACKLTSL